MMALRRIKALMLVFAVAILFVGAFSIFAAPETQAKPCCWVMVCTTSPPIICWEVCRPCR